jgi:small subunit ribosomal protein S9
MSTPVTETPETVADETAQSAEETAAAIDAEAFAAAQAAEAAEASEAAAAEGSAEVEVAVGDEPAPVVVPAARQASADHPVLTVGRRKEAIVRVRLVPGTGQFALNGRSIDSYFPNKVHQQLVKEPLVTLEKDGAYDVIARLSGGGVTGQAGALQLGIARALIEINPDDRPALKKAGFLTRDARVKERKKYGLKKARKAPQYSKR